jgi:acetyl-CoA C-acetyltransferase
MPLLPPHRSPVLIGVGEIVDRTREPLLAREPIALMEEAIRRAVADAAPDSYAELLARVDSLDVVSEHSWPYQDACALLKTRLQLQPRRAAYGVTGGESPVRYIHEAALRIARGESEHAIVTGAEAAYSVANAAKAGVEPPWTPRDANARLLRAKDFCSPLAIQHGVVQPVHVYPLYENAACAAWGRTQAQALQDSSELWSRFSHVAAANPYAWLQRAYTPQEILTATPANRMIAWPYTKHMTANPLVNQGAAVVLTSLAAARELGVREERVVHVCAGASANEPRDYLERDHYHRSTAQEAVLQRALELAGGRFDLIELYSCFPIVPKMARRALALDPVTPMTVTGGLSFFGAPLNNYMTHAAAGLVRALRERPGRVALLYGQGEFVTKHHALVLASSAPRENRLAPDYSVQAEADRARDPAPAVTLDYAGAARLETFTIVYGREGRAEFGCVIGRTPSGERLMARVRADDVATLTQLTRLDSTPVGDPGEVTRGADGLLYWRLNRTDA